MENSRKIYILSWVSGEDIVTAAWDCESLENPVALIIRLPPFIKLSSAVTVTTDETCPSVGIWPKRWLNWIPTDVTYQTMKHQK